MKLFGKIFRRGFHHSSPKLYIIRGIPGSGKSTFGKKLGYPLFEADMFFEKDGQYKFDPSKIKEAHEWCQNQVRKFLASGKSVAVANTFTRKWEIAPYLKMAKEYGAEVVIYRMTGKFQNIHGVPQDIVDKMEERFEEIQGEIFVSPEK